MILKKAHDMKSADLRSVLVLYAVTDRAWIGSGFPCKSLSEAVSHAIEGGATCIQLREKNLDEETFLSEAIEIGKLCASKKIPLIINDSVNVARESGADGVHIGQSDISLAEARRVLGPDKTIGVSCQTEAQAVQAERDGADYLGVGAVFPTSSKSDADSVPLEMLKSICGAVAIPVVAIGGISRTNAQQLAGSGIAGISVISAIFAQADIVSSARELLHIAQTITA